MLGKTAIRAVLATDALTLRSITHDLDDPDFTGESLRASAVIGQLRKVARELEELREDVHALPEERKVP